MIPIGLALLFLTGVGPLLAWRKTSTDSLKRNFGWPLLAGVVAGVLAYVLGYRDIFSILCLLLCGFVFVDHRSGVLSRREGDRRAHRDESDDFAPTNWPCATHAAMAVTSCTSAWF